MSWECNVCCSNAATEFPLKSFCFFLPLSYRLKFQSNPTLKYLYPPLSHGILTNITHALISVPKFYVQVSKSYFFYIIFFFSQLPASLWYADVGQMCRLYFLHFPFLSWELVKMNANVTDSYCWMYKGISQRFLNLVQPLKIKRQTFAFLNFNFGTKY